MTGIRPYGPPSLWEELFGTVGELPRPDTRLGKYENGLEKRHMKTPRNCGSCRFFHNAQRTLCKRYPPVAHGKREAFWPTVLWDDSCGEWEPRPRDEEGTP